MEGNEGEEWQVGLSDYLGGGLWRNLCDITLFYMPAVERTI